MKLRLPIRLSTLLSASRSLLQSPPRAPHPVLPHLLRTPPPPATPHPRASPRRASRSALQVRVCPTRPLIKTLRFRALSTDGLSPCGHPCYKSYGTRGPDTRREGAGITASCVKCPVGYSTAARSGWNTQWVLATMPCRDGHGMCVAPVSREGGRLKALARAQCVLGRAPGGWRCRIVGSGEGCGQPSWSRRQREDAARGPGLLSTGRGQL